MAGRRPAQRTGRRRKDRPPRRVASQPYRRIGDRAGQPMRGETKRKGQMSPAGQPSGASRSRPARRWSLAGRSDLAGRRDPAGPSSRQRSPVRAVARTTDLLTLRLVTRPRRTHGRGRRDRRLAVGREPTRDFTSSRKEGGWRGRRADLPGGLSRNAATPDQKRRAIQPGRGSREGRSNFSGPVTTLLPAMPSLSNLYSYPNTCRRHFYIPTCQRQNDSSCLSKVDAEQIPKFSKLGASAATGQLR